MSFKILSKKVLSKNHQNFESKHFAVVLKRVKKCCYQLIFAKKDLGVFFCYPYMITEDNKKPQKNPKYFCEKCNFITGNKKDYNRHLVTATHIKKPQMITNDNKKPQKTPNDNGFNCACGCQYKFASGLSRHRKKCSIEVKEIPTISNEMVCTLLSELTVAQNQIAELLKIKQPSVSNTITNSNNTQININMFLNENCKNAITINEFIKSIQPTIEDVIYMTKHGNKRGLSKILTTALGQLEITERPIHCTDLKRHTTYVKETEGWKKEQDQKNIKRLCINAQHECMKTALDLMNNDSRFSEPGTEQYEMKAKMIHESVVEPNVEQIAPVLENIMYINRESMSKRGSITN